jgi:putative spermidine/putrescine transport system ATP-binding protein
MTALVFAGVRKTFGSTVALESLDLELAPGEFVSLLGPSGCGKTTALRVAAGFEKPDLGSVSVHDRDITHLPAHKRNMGMVFQSYSLFPNLSVHDNVEFGMRTRNVERAERQRRANEILELVQLGPLAERFPHQLSGGQQQRVALARALAVRPEVLLLDEPLSALDAKVRGSLRDEIRRLQLSLGITTLFVTHDQEEALAISDRVGVMSNGRLEQLGSPREVYRQPSSAFVARFVGSMNELPATVADSRTAVMLGVKIPFGSNPGATDVAQGAMVRLLIRPEDLHLDRDSGDAASVAHETFPEVSGTIVLNSFQGATTVVSVRLDGLDTPVSVHTSGSESTGVPGDRVVVRIDPTRMVIEAGT